MRQTDFSNDEAVGFLADRLNRLGVEDKLLELGAQEGDTVLIGDVDNAVVFDFKPMMDAGPSCSAAAVRTTASTSSARPRRASPSTRRSGPEPRGDRADVARRLAEAGEIELDDEVRRELDLGWDDENDPGTVEPKDEDR